MNWDQIEGKWHELKGLAKQEWGDLTDDDLDGIEGRREELAGKLQQITGKSREVIDAEIDGWCERQEK